MDVVISLLRKDALRALDKFLKLRDGVFEAWRAKEFGKERVGHRNV